MTIGDCYILSSKIHEIDIAVIYIGESTYSFLFAPLNFENDKFNNTRNGIFEGLLITSNLSSLNADITGLCVIDESKSYPSFLIDYCKTNKPFINLLLDVDNILIERRGTGGKQIVIGAGLGISKNKTDFEKFDIQTKSRKFALQHSRYELSPLDLILKK